MCQPYAGFLTVVSSSISVSDSSSAVSLFYKMKRMIVLTN